MTRTITMKLDKETKGAVRYQEVKQEGQPALMGSLYVRKLAIGSAVPQEITVTIDTGA